MTKAIAKVLVINDAGELLCLRRSMSDENRAGGWDFPGGGCDPGEGFTDAVHREALEEAGLKLNDPFVVYSKSSDRQPGQNKAQDNGQDKKGSSISLLYADYVTGRPEVTLSFEHDHYEWMTPEKFLEASDYLRHHEIITFVMAQGLFDAPTRKPARVTGRAVVLNRAGKMLLVRRSATDTQFGGKWDLPGGRAEPGEQPHQTAMREVREEAGIELTDIQPIYALTLDRDSTSITWVFFRGQAVDDQITLSWEHDAYLWIDPAELPQYTDYEVLLRMHTFATTHHLL